MMIKCSVTYSVYCLFTRKAIQQTILQHIHWPALHTANIRLALDAVIIQEASLYYTLMVPISTVPENLNLLWI